MHLRFGYHLNGFEKLIYCKKILKYLEAIVAQFDCKRDECRSEPGIM